jgi:hypothetical protein
MRPSSQAFCASARVLKKRAAHSHLSMRTDPIDVFSYKQRRLGSQKNGKLMRSRLGSPKRQRCVSRLYLCSDAKTHFQEKR